MHPVTRARQGVEEIARLERLGDDLDVPEPDLGEPLAHLLEVTTGHEDGRYAPQPGLATHPENEIDPAQVPAQVVVGQHQRREMDGQDLLRFFDRGGGHRRAMVRGQQAAEREADEVVILDEQDVRPRVPGGFGLRALAHIQLHVACLRMVRCAGAASRCPARSRTRARGARLAADSKIELEIELQIELEDQRLASGREVR